MKVKDIIIRALAFIGRGDLSAALESGQTPSGEGAEALETLLYCFNAAEDELARYYFPLTAEEELTSLTGKFYFSDFSSRPVKILRVQSQGKDISYTLYPLCLEADAVRITVSYRYAPVQKTIEEDSAFDGVDVGEALVAAGAASEFCLINGEMTAAQLWESRYRREIDRAQRNMGEALHVPPRRWV